MTDWQEQLDAFAKTQAQIDLALEWAVVRTNRYLDGDKSRRRLILQAVRVGQLLERVGQSSTAVIAGYLEALVTGESVTRDAVRETFGPAVADLVDATTSDIILAESDRAAAEADLVTRATACGGDAVAVVVADHAVALLLLSYLPPDEADQLVRDARTWLEIARQWFQPSHSLIFHLRHNLEQAQVPIA